MSMRHSAQRPRRHGECLEPVDRRALERTGWRTTMDYRENHVRTRDGRLVEIEAVWIVEAERLDDGVMVAATATGRNVEEAWANLRADIDDARVRTLSRVRLVGG